MTTTGPHPAGRLRRLLEGSASIAVAILVMNVATYGFQMVAARTLGPAEYGGFASLMALLLVIAVVQLGLQATAARQIAAAPGDVSRIAPAMLRLTDRAALVLGGALLVASPLVWKLLRLDGIVPALLVAACAVPLTMVGGQAGILQGERRWHALGVLYLAMGLPRLVLGTAAMLVRPDATSAMVGVLLGALTPVAVGRYLLRGDVHAAPGSQSSLRTTARESLRNSFALLSFLVLSNTDIVVARNVMDDHEAGLYAGGLILTKAVLFLPQFVVVVAFPSMSTVHERRQTLVRSLLLVLGLGVLSTVGAWLLSGLALVFVGGSEYAEVRADLWLFAVLGTLLAMLQLLVYSVLARQGSHATPSIWAAVGLVAVAGTVVDTVPRLVAAVAAVDAALLAVLLLLSLRRLARDEVAAQDQ